MPNESNTFQKLKLYDKPILKRTILSIIPFLILIIHSTQHKVAHLCGSPSKQL